MCSVKFTSPSEDLTTSDLVAVHTSLIDDAMKRKARTIYSEEFKLEALRMIAAGDCSKTQIAKDLGIRVNKLRYWSLEFTKLTGTNTARISAIEKVTALQRSEKDMPITKSTGKRHGQVDSKTVRTNISVSSTSKKVTRK